MQFQVPQFIEVEDKIFGPLTFKQFVYTLGGAGLGYMFWRLTPSYIGAPLAFMSLGIGAALAFTQYNSRPLIVNIEYAFYYLLHSKLYLWNNARRSHNQEEAAASDAVQDAEVYVPRLTDSRLHELSWSLDINERIAAGTVTDDDRTETQPRHAVVAPIRTARAALAN